MKRFAVAMNRLGALSLCMLLAMSAVASADILPTVQVSADSGGLGFAVTVDTTSNPGYNVVDVYLTALPTGNTGLGLFQGELTETGGGLFYVTNKAANVGSFQTNTTWTGLDGGPGKYTCFNLGTANSACMWARDGGTTNFTSFLLGGWHDGGNADDALIPGTNRDIFGGPVNSDGYARNLVGEFVIQNVAGVTQTIRLNCDPNDPRETNGFNYMPNGTTMKADVLVGVPEPSTFILLGIGAIGLLGYAWRRRER